MKSLGTDLKLLNSNCIAFLFTLPPMLKNFRTTTESWCEHLPVYLRSERESKEGGVEVDMEAVEGLGRTVHVDTEIGTGGVAGITQSAKWSQFLWMTKSSTTESRTRKE